MAAVSRPSELHCKEDKTVKLIIYKETYYCEWMVKQGRSSLDDVHKFPAFPRFVTKCKWQLRYQTKLNEGKITRNFLLKLLSVNIGTFPIVALYSLYIKAKSSSNDFASEILDRVLVYENISAELDLSLNADHWPFSDNELIDLKIRIRLVVLITANLLDESIQDFCEIPENHEVIVFCDMLLYISKVKMGLALNRVVLRALGLTSLSGFLTVDSLKVYSGRRIITHLDYNVIERFLRFVYFNSAIKLNFQEAKTLLRISVRHGISDIQNVCLDAINVALNHYNAMDVLRFAFHIDCVPLQRNVIEFILNEPNCPQLWKIVCRDMLQQNFHLQIALAFKTRLGQVTRNPSQETSIHQNLPPIFDSLETFIDLYNHFPN